MPANDINFMPADSQPNGNGDLSLRDQIFQWIIKHGKRIVLITQAIVLIIFISRFKFDSDIRNITQEIEKNEAVVQSYSDLEKRYLHNQERLGLIKPVIEKQINWEERLADFNEKIPDDLTLSNLQFQEDSITITAKTENAQSFQIFVNLLVEDRDIQSAVLQSSSFDTETNEYTFVINMEI